MDLFAAIEQRASVRSLEPTEVTEADLERILDAGRRAPSGRNIQPFDFIVIRDRRTLAKLASAQKCIGDVGLGIALVADPSQSQYWLEDVSAATENMLLAITALGYASVWIEGTLLRAEDEHKRTLGVPENLRLIVLLPIGAAVGSAQQAPKRPLDEMVYWERYGNRGPE
ncbi:MAG: nitroreductase family protein [Armatimonadota bacterium]